MFQGQHLYCQRNGRDLFSNLTFSLEPGQWLQVEGPNGSGKSSLLRVLLGLLPSQTGKIFWEGREIRFPDPFFSSQVRYLGQKIGIQARLTPQENLQGWFHIQKTPPLMRAKVGQEAVKQLKPSLSLRVKSALENWDLLESADKPSEQLSQGQCQRLALARLTLLPARLWVLDEPCTALDAKGVQYFKKNLQEHLEQGGMLIMVSHTPLVLDVPRQTLVLGAA